MSLSSFVKLFLEFNNSNSLIDSVTLNPFLVEGDNDSMLVLDNNMGYVMQQDQYLSKQNFNINISDQFVLGFWLYPKNTGVILDGDDINPVKISLLNIIDASNGSSLDGITLYEETLVDGNNKLVISFDENGYAVRTDAYTKEKWHIFLISYDEGVLRVNIDGKTSILEALNPSTSLPIELSINVSDIFINKKTLSGDNIINNQGYIDDIFILNQTFDAVSQDEIFVERLTTNSASYVLNEDNEDTEDIYNGFYMEKDMTTIEINSITRSTNRYFIGRSDGKIMEGCSLLWESRRDFSNKNEESIINERVLGEPVVVQDGFARVKNSIIRL